MPGLPVYLTHSRSFISLSLSQLFPEFLQSGLLLVDQTRHRGRIFSRGHVHGGDTAFAEHYAKSGNATEAARAAGYSERSANRIGPKLLSDVGIAAYVEELAEKLRSKRIADVVELREFWTSVLRSPTEEMRDRIKAAELLAKSLGLFLEKVQLSGPNGAPLGPPPNLVINFVPAKDGMPVIEAAP
ncbi:MULTISPECIES: terminase small subunit [unclassified Methylococcus]|uniref:terminase small subunit n=1 Tax=unclassified Methylococcus TaxID=2618889 RepID=UPI003D7DA767